MVNVYDQTGTLLTTLDTGVGGFTTGSASNGNFYVTNFSTNQIFQFAQGGSNTNLGAFGVGGTYANDESMLFNKAGNVYVGNAGAGRIIELDSAGNVLNTFSVATEDRGADWIDLSSDQKTMLYTSEGSTVKRFDVSGGGQLTDFASGLTGGTAYALRILGDGSVLVADSGNVTHLDSSGNIIGTYLSGVGSGGLFSLNLDSDGTSFWTGSFANGDLYKVDIATGTILQTIATGSGSLFGVSVYGEITQGGGGAVPEPSQLGISSALIGLVALFRYLRKPKSVENA
jgi:streptogramin lyase